MDSLLFISGFLLKDAMALLLACKFDETLVLGLGLLFFGVIVFPLFRELGTITWMLAGLSNFILFLSTH